MTWLCQNRRVLAIDPTTKGFGFVVLEGPDRLVDWGLRRASGDKNASCLQCISRLIDALQPDLLVVEDTTILTRRCSRVRRLLEYTVQLAETRRMRTRRISQVEVKSAFPELLRHTKHEVAVAAAVRFPELQPLLPPARKPWMSEDERMGVFDALAFALASSNWHGDAGFSARSRT